MVDTSCSFKVLTEVLGGKTLSLEELQRVESLIREATGNRKSGEGYLLGKMFDRKLMDDVKRNIKDAKVQELNNNLKALEMTSLLSIVEKERGLEGLKKEALGLLEKGHTSNWNKTSVENLSDYIKTKLHNELANMLEDTGLVKDFTAKDIQEPLYAKITWNQDLPEGHHFRKTVDTLAGIVRNITDNTFLHLKDAGVILDKNSRYLPRLWDFTKSSFDDIFNGVLQSIDLVQTFGKHMESHYAAMIKSISDGKTLDSPELKTNVLVGTIRQFYEYNNAREGIAEITFSGKPITIDVDDTGVAKAAAKKAARVSNEQKLVFKSAADQWEFQQKFGKFKSVNDIVINHIDSTAKDSAIITLFGTDPSKTLSSVSKFVSSRIKDSTERSGFKTSFKNAAEGVLSGGYYGNPHWFAKAMRGVGNFIGLVKLTNSWQLQPLDIIPISAVIDRVEGNAPFAFGNQIKILSKWTKRAITNVGSDTSLGRALLNIKKEDTIFAAQSLQKHMLLDFYSEGEGNWSKTKAFIRTTSMVNTAAYLNRVGKRVLSEIAIKNMLEGNSKQLTAWKIEAEKYGVSGSDIDAAAPFLKENGYTISALSESGLHPELTRRVMSGLIRMTSDLSDEALGSKYSKRRRVPIVGSYKFNGEFLNDTAITTLAGAMQFKHILTSLTDTLFKTNENMGNLSSAGQVAKLISFSFIMSSLVTYLRDVANPNNEDTIAEYLDTLSNNRDKMRMFLMKSFSNTMSAGLLADVLLNNEERKLSFNDTAEKALTGLAITPAIKGMANTTVRPSLLMLKALSGDKSASKDIAKYAGDITEFMPYTNNHIYNYFFMKLSGETRSMNKIIKEKARETTQDLLD